MAFFRRPYDRFLVRGISKGIAKESDTVIDHPRSHRSHAIFLAEFLQKPARGFTIGIVIEMALSHQLIQRVVHQ